MGARFLTENDYITSANLDSTLVGEWSILRIAYGRKTYLSSLYKEDLSWNVSVCRSSGKPFLETTENFAREIALVQIKNGETKIGITNRKGLQIMLAK